MTDCLVFLHGHQPYYNEEFIVKEIIWQSYGPLFKLLLDYSKEHQFHFNLSLTGSVIQWFERLNNDFLLSALGELIDRGVVELLLSPFYHAPLALTNDGFIKEQFYHHRKMVKDLFGKEMRGLFPPELVFTTQKNYLLNDLDVDYSIIEGSHKIFHTDDIEGIWKTNTKKPVFLIPRNRALSWHFSDSDFPNAKWMLNKINEKDGPVTIGCDVECFGHHRGSDSFKFLDYFIKRAKDNNVNLLRVGDIVKKYKKNAPILTDETITTWARSINVFFPHAKIIEMWFARNDAVSTYYRVEYLYFKLETYFREKIKKKKSVQKKFDKLVELKMELLDDIRWSIYRELTDAALYHEDFSNENTYRAMLDKCGWIKEKLWEVEKELSKLMMSI